MMKHPSQSHHKHIPIRTCVVCQTKDDKRVLTRLVRTDAGVVVDLSGKMNGRGAYICDSANCWERAVNTNILNKALKTLLTHEDRERLRQALP
jgi:predicted RNA-binding protein YlxR (DUF448 family)